MNRLAQEARERQRMLEYLKRQENVTEAAKRFHVSRKTVYKWRKRWDGTVESLYEQSRAPVHQRQGHTPELDQLVKRLAKRFHYTDLIQAYQTAKQQNGYPFGYATFKRRVRALCRDEVKKPGRRKNKPYKRAEYLGQKVQVDVKYVPNECVMDGKQYDVYVAVDECSRWAYRKMYDEHSTYSSKQFLDELIRHTPFPIHMIQTDNGSEFTKEYLRKPCDKKGGKLPAEPTLFEQGLQAYDIMYHRIRPRTPRHNGKVECQNRLDEERFYNDLRMYSLADGNKQLEKYQKKSNAIWKVCLGMRSPNDVVLNYLSVGVI